MKPSAAQDSQIEDARQDLPAKDSKQKWDDPEGSYRRGFEHGGAPHFRIRQASLRYGGWTRTPAPMG
jgi:hypothetical protein